jgi:arylsulfatase A
MKGIAVVGRCLIGLVALLSCVSGTLAQRPNVVVIMADDLGYETIGANGGTSYKTPVLDRMAAEGVRFTHCYVQPLCTPTRVQLMTGKYNVRNYVNFGEMDPQAVTFGNVFKQAGYVTCMAGKWQLGRDVQLPKKYGFDEYCLWQHTRRPPRYVNPGLEINGVEKDFSKGEYGPDLVNEYAIDFVMRNKERPFFLYYPMMLTHGPYMPTPDSKDWDPKIMGERDGRSPEHFGDMVQYMDKLIGKLLAGLDKAGVRENTLVLFLGDNGTGAGTRSMMGQREVIGGKGSTTETGMHVPLIASWPGHIARGKVSSDLVDSTDLLPTICAAAGITLPKDLVVDGRTFLPQLRGEAGQPRKWIYSWYSPRGERLREFAFNHNYKLYRGGEFFDLKADPEETKPLQVASLSGEGTAAAKELQGALDQYRGARPSSLPQPEGLEAGAKVKGKGKGKRAKKI